MKAQTPAWVFRFILGVQVMLIACSGNEQPLEQEEAIAILVGQTQEVVLEEHVEDAELFDDFSARFDKPSDSDSRFEVCGAAHCFTPDVPGNYSLVVTGHRAGAMRIGEPIRYIATAAGIDPLLRVELPSRALVGELVRARVVGAVTQPSTSLAWQVEDPQGNLRTLGTSVEVEFVPELPGAYTFVLRVSQGTESVVREARLDVVEGGRVVPSRQISDESPIVFSHSRGELIYVEDSTPQSPGSEVVFWKVEDDSEERLSIPGKVALMDLDPLEESLALWSTQGAEGDEVLLVDLSSYQIVSSMSTETSNEEALTNIGQGRVILHCYLNWYDLNLNLDEVESYSMFDGLFSLAHSPVESGIYGREFTGILVSFDLSEGIVLSRRRGLADSCLTELATWQQGALLFSGSAVWRSNALGAPMLIDSFDRCLRSMSENEEQTQVVLAEMEFDDSTFDSFYLVDYEELQLGAAVVPEIVNQGQAIVGQAAQVFLLSDTQYLALIKGQAGHLLPVIDEL